MRREYVVITWGEVATALLTLEAGSTVSVEVTWELMEERDRQGVYVFGTRGSAGTSPLTAARRQRRLLANLASHPCRPWGEPR